MRHLLVGFFHSRRGNVTVTAALFLPVIIGMTVLNVELISYDRGQTRLHQAQMAAALATAKEGDPDAPGTDLSAISAKYISANMGALGDEAKWHLQNIHISNTDVDKKNCLVAARADFGNWFAPISNRMLPPVDQQVKAQRYYRKMETVVVMDCSSSMTANKNGVDQLATFRDGVINYIESAFDAQGSSNDHRISLLSFSKYTNLNLKYKDKLVTSESRRWKAKYPYLQAVADENGWGGTDDLLSDRGPEGIRGGAPVARKLIMDDFGGSTAAYVESADIPPENKDDGFNLVMVLGNNEQPPTQAKKTFSRVTSVNYAYSYATNMRDVNQKTFTPEFGLQIPKADMNMWPTFLDANSDYHFEWYKHYLGRSVMVEANAGSMPMLVHSNNRQELVDNLNWFGGSSSTGSDEGMMWALRILSPNWTGIWEINDDDGESVPAPYHGDVDKRVILLSDGADNQGNFKNGTIGSEQVRNIYPDLGDYMRDRGIEFFFLHFDLNMAILNGTKTNIGYIIPETSPNFFVVTEKDKIGAEKLLAKLKEWGKRKYRVRLAE